MFRGEPEFLIAGCAGEQTGVVTYVDVMSRGSVQLGDQKNEKMTISNNEIK